MDSSQDADTRKTTKVAVLKWYDILIETFHRYCKVGGDDDWLTYKGWTALVRDAFVPDPDKKGGKCTEQKVDDLFEVTYWKHNAGQRKWSLRKSQIFHRKKAAHAKQSTLSMIMADWNDADPWTGIWVDEADESEEQYKIKQIGDMKIQGFIKSFEFCEINGMFQVIGCGSCGMT